MQSLKQKKQLICLIHVAETLITVMCCFLMLELSSGSSLSHLQSMEIRYILLNWITLGVILTAFLIVSNRVWLSCLLCTYFCGIVAIINHYVLMYHGMPLSFLVLKNLATAMKVASSYSFKIDRIVVALLLAMILLSAFVWWTYNRTKLMHTPNKKHCIGIRNAVLVIAGAGLLYFSYFGSNPVKPKKTIGWSWSEAYHKYGYTSCTIESITQSINIINQPEGYYDGVVETIEIQPDGNDYVLTPDVILILNETFYDLSQVADFDTDVPYLQNIENMDNTRIGYAITPSIGGGTNSSEYELLTSNSLQLMPGITPFNVLDLFGANSIVSHLNELGYYTTGSHSEQAVNYSRGQGYRALGFQNTYFDNDFLNKEYYYGRWFETDKCLYENLIRWYEESPVNAPRFQYLLTIQNHGAWNIDNPEHDIVHVKNDFGENTESMNEFLTGMYLSDQAFKGLTDYFAQQNRQVIVCMVGDHAPNFAKDIIDEKYSEQEQQLLLRKVPLVIWANFDLGDYELGTMSMNYVVPTLFDLAKIELSPYYSYLLEIKESVPILSSYGSYYTLDGDMYKYDEDDGSEYRGLVEDYFYLEYNNLQESRNQNLFMPWD